MKQFKLFLIKLARKNILKLSDKKFLDLCFDYYLGKKINWDNPQTYNEKLQWLKIYDRQDRYTKMVDKYEAKNYVKNIIGQEYIIPTIGIYDKFEDINFDKLPQQFVMKCTHDSGGLVICKDKNKLNLKETKKKIDKCLKVNYFNCWKEWPYRNVKPRIIIEKYMSNSDSEGINDYKFFCFNGKVKLLFIATDRVRENEETKFDFYDENFNHLPIKNGHPNAIIPPSKPINFEKMKELAEILSTDIPHLRVDFYEINGKIYFGELTFSHWAGMVPFEPEEYDLILGNWIDIKKIKQKDK